MRPGTIIARMAMLAIFAAPTLVGCTSGSSMDRQGFSFSQILGSAAAEETGTAAMTDSGSIDASESAAQTQAADRIEPAAVAAADMAEAPRQEAVEDNGEASAAAELTPAEIADESTPKRKRSFLTAFWSGGTRSVSDEPATEGTSGAAARAAAGTAAPEAKPAAPQVRTAKAAPEPKREPLARSFRGGEDALPGVRVDSLFEITRKSGLEDDRDIDLNEDDATYRVASAAGMARLAPNGLLKQREDVEVSCLKPSLVRMLKSVERRFGKRVIVTSGYRSPAHNKRVRGAPRSYHMACAAADIQVPGISKWELAKYVRSLPGRGGVGTYCHTVSVHVDVGPERDWNWRCRRKA